MKHHHNLDNASFIKHGFLIRKNFLNFDDIKNVIESFLSLCVRLGGEHFAGYSIKDFYNNQKFTLDLLNLREQYPKKFGALYDVMQTTISMQKLALNDIIANDISNLLDTKITNLMCFNYLFRMDPPFCKRNSLDWHQDFVDYDQKDMSDGITAWIPLIDINNDIGPLKALVGSHAKGKVSNYVIEEESKSELSSHKHKISADVTNKFKEISLPVEIGDIIYISMNLIHSSGENISQKIRFSAQGRYFNTLSKHFPPGRPQFIKSKLY